jgi:formylglycine-generating enzyme required for sulfatase activity/tRNA A-37 threonylcarbamoyl transferase component Bud32
LLQGVREGSDESLQQIRALCREYLLAIAFAEPTVSLARQADVQALVDQALLKLPELLSNFTGQSDSDLRERLRQILLDQLPGSPPQHGSSEAARSTRDHDSGKTPETGGAASTGAAHPTTSPADGGAALAENDSQLHRQTVAEKDAGTADRNTDRFLPGQPQLEGFERISQVAAGGMGIVYKAWQIRPPRWVALKSLPADFACDPRWLDRFRREAELSAGLTQPGILQVYAVLDGGGTPFLVLPYIDGSDLERILGQRRLLRDSKEVVCPHPMALKGDRDFLNWLLPFFDKILDALVSLHGAGVLHRDLKPSNILVDRDGNGWLTDFGLARPHQSDPAEADQAVGTRGFMSPEQWSGEGDIDARTDVFAMGVTLFQALTLGLPYGRTIITAATPPVAVSKAQRRAWPANLDLVILKAVHPNRRLRYQTAADLRADWQRVRNGKLPPLVHVGTKRRLLHVARRRMTQAVAVAAVGLAAVLAAILMTPPAKVVRKVHVSTEPPGADVALVPLSPDDGTPQFAAAIRPRGKTPVDVPAVPPGDYLVVAEVPNYGFHEVYRRVPEPGEKVPSEFKTLEPGRDPGAARAAEAPGSKAADTRVRYFPHRFFEENEGVVSMPSIRVPKLDVSEGMVLFRGGEFTMGNAELDVDFARPHTRSVEPFYLDKTEVTVADFRAARRDIPAALGKLLPADSEPVRFVTFDEAVRYAEQIGKRLPDEAEYEFAATNAGRNRFPWGDDFNKIESWKIGPVGTPGYDRTSTDPPVFGLFSNVAEWTMSRNVPYPAAQQMPEAMTKELVTRLANDRIVRGGPFWVINGDARPQGRSRRTVWHACDREGIDRDRAFPGLGFRCARSLRPRFPQSQPGKKNVYTGVPSRR